MNETASHRADGRGSGDPGLDPADPLAALRREVAGHDLPDAFEEFLLAYYGEVPRDRLAERRTEELLGVAVTHWRLLQDTDGDPRAEVLNPTMETTGWRSSSTVALTVTTDSPFIVDTLSMTVEEVGPTVQLRVHTVVEHAGEQMALLALLVDRVPDEEAGVLAERVRGALGDVSTVVADWPAMIELTTRLAGELEGEERRFLEWLADGHFVLLASDGPDVDPKGLLRREKHRTIVEIPDEDDEDDEVGVRVTQALQRSPVHRSTRIDLVIVTIESGRYLIAGLFTADTYVGSVMDVPILSERVEEVHRLTGWEPGTHRGNVLRAELERHPRDELFEIAVDDLTHRAVQLVHLSQRSREVGLFVTADRFHRSWSALVLVPADRFDTDVRLRIADVLARSLGGELIEHTSSVGEGAHSRVHFGFKGRLESLPDERIEELRQVIASTVRAWRDDLRDELIASFGDRRGQTLYDAFKSAFPPEYSSSTSPAVALADISEIVELDDRGGFAIRLARELEAPADTVQLSIYHRGAPITLTTLLPILHDLGVEVVDERPFDGAPADGEPFRLLRLTIRTEHARRLLSGDGDDRFAELFRRVWFDQTENDAVNRLGLAAGLDWRAITVMRAYSRYLRQIGVWFDSSFLSDTLIEHAGITTALAALFSARFDPDLDPQIAAQQEAELLESVEEGLADVASLDQDRALRTLLDVMTATTRTNHFQVDHAGEAAHHLALKLDPTQIADLPLPRPAFEIYVYAPDVEGVHLRGGPVARGGLRHSDRIEDYRTEILQLMKAQVTKNAVIVPTGAKGGFVCRRLHRSDRAAMAAEVERCYRIFITGLLDVTDDLVRGEIVPPERVRRHDGDDAYLVVAADKGTATFSDVANEIACERGFWLGDAFASGGSEGYDHKAMGITARGAWVSVTDHLHHRGIDVDADPFTVVGIGDMSGDVFGNGMLLSDQIRLVAAFDHRHVFIDPEPDPAVSHAERQRLFELPRSSWADYDTDLLSEGGGVHDRSLKSVTLSPEAWRALGLSGEPEPRPPAAIIRAILAAPVDLLWNGGIGTYLKASGESDRDAGDKTNDEVRIDASELCCAVVGEGGNLGFTPRARIEYARDGGRIFTDAVDNAAGVNCSDHEVNIKILLDRVVDDGQLTTRQRNELLAEMTDEVAELTLDTNRAQAIALDNAVAEAAPMVNVHRNQIEALEENHGLDRAVEHLPDDDALAERTDGGLTAPELAVVMAYTKNWITEHLIEADLTDETHFDDVLVDYFPTPLRERYGAEIREHQLAKELVATAAANDVVHRAGVSMVHRLSDETAAETADVVRAHAAAWGLFGGTAAWDEISEAELRPRIRTELRLAHRRCVERATRWMLRNRRPPIEAHELVETYQDVVGGLAGLWPELVPQRTRNAIDEACEHWAAEGVPENMAMRAAATATMTTALDVADVSAATGVEPPQVARLHFALEEFLGVETLKECVDRLPRDNRWQTLARSALRDDLHRSQAGLTATVIREADGVEETGLVVERWAERNGRLLSRWWGVAADLAQSGPPALDQLSVTVREFRNLGQQVDVLDR